MIGDNPVVIVIVTLAIVAFLYMKLARRRDPRLCPQCKRLVLGLGASTVAGAELSCPHCGTELVRAPDGVLSRRRSPG